MKNLLTYYILILSPIGVLIWLNKAEKIDVTLFVGLFFFYAFIYRTYTDGKRLADKNIIPKHIKISKMRPDASRWSIVHEFLNDENKLCAIITVDGAWMDTKLRKIANPTPEIAMDAIRNFPKLMIF